MKIPNIPFTYFNFRRPLAVTLFIAAAIAISIAAVTGPEASAAFGFLFLVTTTDDHNDGVCDSDCTLREAILAADNAVGTPAGQLGTISSSRRFKEDIEPMEKSSEAILGLKPVTFHYKSDTQNTPQFGLIAEEVAKVNPDLVVRDDNGQIYTIRYEAVNAMLLNEFLKEHRNVAEQQSTIAELKTTVAQQQKQIAAQQSTAAQQQRQIEALTATVQKVSERVELSVPAPQLAANED